MQVIRRIHGFELCLGLCVVSMSPLSPFVVLKKKKNKNKQKKKEFRSLLKALYYERELITTMAISHNQYSHWREHLQLDSRLGRSVRSHDWAVEILRSNLGRHEILCSFISPYLEHTTRIYLSIRRNEPFAKRRLILSWCQPFNTTLDG